MFFLRKDQVDRDVEKLRENLMTPYQIAEKEDQKAREKKQYQEAVEGFGWKDVLAMTIAIIEVILPYFLLLVGAMVAVYLFLYYGGRAYYG